MQPDRTIRPRRHLRPGTVLGTVLGIGLVVGMMPVARAAPSQPPFQGTVFVDADIITDADPSAYVDVHSTGRGTRNVFDRRTAAFGDINAYLFLVRFSDGTTVEGIVNPEFGSTAAARTALEAYLPDLGRMPRSLRTDLDEIWLHKGDDVWGGGNRSILIHDGQGAIYARDNVVPETMVHELAHTSLDAAHEASSGWLAAQQSDPTFISNYARDNPTREDVAETVLPWFAVRHAPTRVDNDYKTKTNDAVPARLAYFDSLGMDLTPLVGGSPIGGPLGGIDGDRSRAGHLDQQDPTQVSIDLSGLRYPTKGSAQVAVLGRDDTYPDALAAASLTATGPLLFTASKQLEESVKAELARVLPAGKTVYLLGGTTALSADVENAVKALGFTTQRIAGDDRVQTALRIGDEVAGGAATRVALARAFPTAGDASGTSGWADSVSGGAWAADRGVPVVVTPVATLDDRLLAWLKTKGVGQIDILGGTAAISSGVEQRLVAEGFTVTRHAGADRVGTSVAIAQRLWGQAATGPRRYIVIPGFSSTGWAAGLAAAGLAATHDAPLLAVTASAASGPAHDAVTNCSGHVVDLTFVGSTSAFSAAGNPSDRSWMERFEQLDGNCPP